MTLTRRFLMAAAGAVAMAMATGTAYADLKIGLSAEPYPPFSSKDASGNWVGWEIDFMNALCAELGEKCTTEEVAWDGIIPALVAKKFDALIGSMSITDERKKTIDFSDMYYNSPALVIGPKDGDKDITPEHFKGKTFGVQVSTIHSNYVDKYFKSAGAEVKTYGTEDEAKADLAAGRVDYVMGDSLTLFTFLDTDAGKACCEAKGFPPDDKEILGEGVGMGIRKEDTALKERLNKAIHALSAKGTLTEISKKWGLDGQMKLASPQ